jgi:DNA-binding LacI/PurR family transcriptional regulator
LTPFWLYRDGVTGERFCEILWARGIRGMLLNPFPYYGAQLDLPWHRFSVVAHGLSLSRPVFNRTSNDHYQSMLLVMSEVRRRGYTRPGFALEEPMTVRLEYRWEAAYLMTCVKLGYPQVPRLLTPAQPAHGAIVEWARREQVDVVIGVFLEGDMDALGRSGIGTPRGIGLASLAVPHPGSNLAGIYQNPEVMGGIAANQLIDMMERNETGIPDPPLTLTIPGVWNEGRTLRTSCG